MKLALGVDIGQGHDPTGVCVAEIQERTREGRRLQHFLVRHLDRLDARMPFPRIARRVGKVVKGIERETGTWPVIYLDVTGLGEPIVKLIDAEVPCEEIYSVYFNHGDRQTIDGSNISLGKAYLVAQLKTLLEDDRLHLPKTSQADDLVRDLLDFRIPIDPGGNERHGAFSVGRRDDLVTALGLATQPPPVTATWEVW